MPSPDPHDGRLSGLPLTAMMSPIITNDEKLSECAAPGLCRTLNADLRSAYVHENAVCRDSIYC
jgi:hypothetical protein